MKKLSLDDLRIESYASQVSESELAEIKGGTAQVCLVAGLVIAALGLTWEVFLKDNKAVRKFLNLELSTSGGPKIKIITLDSIVRTYDDGTEERLYGVEAREALTSDPEVMQQLLENFP